MNEPEILIAGYPYIREAYLNTFNYYPAANRIFFLLPEIWKAKEGKVVFEPPARPNVFKTRAYFYHSNYPLVGGLLKGWMPFFPLKLWELTKGKNIKLVYSASEPTLLTTLYFGFWTKLFGLKHIVFSWENIPYDKKFKGIKLLVFKLILKLNLAFSDGVICGNKKGRDIFNKLTKKSIVVIPMSGADEYFFKPSQPRPDKIFKGKSLKDKTVFLFAGAIGLRKGIHLALKAFSRIIQKYPNSYFIIVGSGEYDHQIEDLIRELKLGDYILRVPWLDKEGLKEVLSISDIFLYPSLSYGGWEEQFGYSMAEASLMELPVISTNSGSINDVVIDGKTGILVEPDSESELEKGMLALLKDPNLGIKMGQAGRKFISENFSHPMIARKFFNFFSLFKPIKP